jgi:hypothetical protein
VAPSSFQKEFDDNAFPRVLFFGSESGSGSAGLFFSRPLTHQTGLIMKKMAKR